MQKPVLDQIGEVVRLCEDTDGIVIVNRNGIVEYHRISLDSYWCSQETEGRHILELYPELDEDSSTILQALRTGKPTYNVLQDINNRRGQRVLLESTTIPIVVDGQVECVVDSSKYHAIDQRVIRGDSGGLYTLDHIITQDAAMLTLKARIRDVAPLDSSVLIYGETGTGKELVAESLHSEGKRSGKPFVSQNCAAIPSNLLESLFFGTEKGSYTGALTRKGLLEEADGGTLFLDEINSMEIGLQAKLLKVLEEKKVRRLGGSRDIPFDVRIVAAVNEDPAKLIREHRLREDLYYRLGVVRITLPPLRKRKGDIALLTRHFIDRYNQKMKRDIRGISEQALRRLEQYSWPGNVRELQNVVEGAYVSARSEMLLVDHMADTLDQGLMELDQEPAVGDTIGEGFSLPQALEQYERELVRRAMAQSTSISQAARLLGVSRQNLKYRLQKFDL
ncbi:MAG TPA: sigma 54-interacting transcriptional regulator [Candidatus Flavonifractor merdavium]|nr:sigma 54-interacting transcriptional regulator [Candidatus Flavonifractor merdavium]